MVFCNNNLGDSGQKSKSTTPPLGKGDRNNTYKNSRGKPGKKKWDDNKGSKDHRKNSGVPQNEGEEAKGPPKNNDKARNNKYKPKGNK